MERSQARTPVAAFVGLMLMSAATLTLEVCLTRVLSVSLWYHFAFMVVSTALFGLGFAGVALSLRKRPENLPSSLLAFAAFCTPPSFVLGYWLYNIVPFEPFSLGTKPLQWLWLPLSYLAVTLPFFFSGLSVASVLTRFTKSIHKLYLFDLIGAGAGCLAVVILLPWIGGSGSVFVAASIAGLGAALLGLEHDSRWSIGAVLFALVLLALSFWADEIVPVRISSNKVVGNGQTVAEVFRDPAFHKYTAWNTISRVDVIEFKDIHGNLHRSALIDAGTAVTRLAHPSKPVEKLGPTSDEEGWFVRFFSSPDVLVVGSGGGREVLLALRNGASRVVGVEINPAINDLVSNVMADFTGHLYDDPRVEIHTDEARSFIRRSGEKFNLIHCPHTISNAAMASGSLSLAENHLMTMEAFGDYLDHLHAGGVLLITRPEAHLPRLFVTARKIFEERKLTGVESSVLAWRARSRGLSFYAGFAMSNRPFTKAELAEFDNVLKKRRMEPLYLPSLVERPPYRALLTSSDPRRVPVPFATILEPATDDEPFFNRRVPFSKIGIEDLLAVFSPGSHGRMALEDRPVAESALIVLLVESMLVSLIFILLPLWIFRRRAIVGKGLGRTIVAFASLGLAYIVVEVGLIQRFNLFLGKPVVVFATVLGTLLVSSGLGSAFARRFRSSRAGMVAAMAAAGTGLVTAMISPFVVDAALVWPAWGRVLLSMGLLFPAGFVMGMPFPLMIRRVDEFHPERIPWAWGVNGFASVVGSISAVLLGMTLGFTIVVLVGVCFYIVAALSSVGIGSDLGSKT